MPLDSAFHTANLPLLSLPLESYEETSIDGKPALRCFQTAGNRLTAIIFFDENYNRGYDNGRFVKDEYPSGSGTDIIRRAEGYIEMQTVISWKGEIKHQIDYNRARIDLFPGGVAYIVSRPKLLGLPFGD